MIDIQLLTSDNFSDQHNHQEDVEEIDQHLQVELPLIAIVVGEKAQKSTIRFKRLNFCFRIQHYFFKVILGVISKLRSRSHQDSRTNKERRSIPVIK